MTMIPYAKGTKVPIQYETGISPEMAGLAIDRAYAAGRYVARGLSGARKRARARRRRRRSATPRPMVVSGRRREAILDAPIAAPTAYGARIKQDYSGLDKYVVKHSEYIKDVHGSIAFVVDSLRINAASVSTFPWLASLAPNFEKYRFKKLRFSLKPQAPSVKPGVIMLAFDYDPTDPPPDTKAEMLQFDGATRVNSWSSVSMDMKSVEARYTAALLPASSADIRLSDAAIIHIATQAQDNYDAISELWAEYEVELITPQARPPCDAFGLTKASWSQNTKFSETNVTNESAYVKVNTNLDSTLTVLKSGKYGVYANWYKPTGTFGDISVDPVQRLILSHNGTAVSQNQAAGPSATLPLQSQASTATFAAGLDLTAGDNLNFTQEYLDSSATLVISLYSLD